MLNKKAFAAAVATQPAYIEDVFSTWLYTGNGSTQTINNGIDLSTKGGLTLFKGRSGATDWAAYDTARGATFDLATNTTGAQTTQSTGLTAFNSNGFSIGALSKINTNAATYASWTFAKQAKFFDVVTYTGNGTAGRTISHNLGSTPGCIIVKCTSSAGYNWSVYHRSLTSNQYALQLQATAAELFKTAYWNSTNPSSTVFTVGNDADVNENGQVYVAYLFAHNAGGFGLSGTDNVISCGSYTGNGSATGPIVTLNYEPQWLLIKRSDSTGDWQLIDNMRGFVVGGTDAELNPNLSNAESTGTFVTPTATGFQLNTTDAGYNASGGTYIYIAIRRGPMKTPTDATKVFTPVVYSGTASSGLKVTTNIITDLVIGQKRNGAEVYQHNWTDRLRGPRAMIYSPSTAVESSLADWVASFSLMDGVTLYTDASVNESGTNNHVMYGFRRAPGFFDVVCYTGTGSNRTVDHNLKAVPELMIVKRRDTTADWQVYYGVGTEYMVLNSTAARVTSNTDRWNSTAPTSSVFSLGTSTTVNASGGTYVNYLFSSCTGVSKVGTYTGTGTTLAINCGFTGGARFVLIKRTDSTGDWHVWDTARGIVSGNDPYLLLNSTDAEVTTTDWIDPVSTGFELSSTAPAALNANGGTYIYLAIA